MSFSDFLNKDFNFSITFKTLPNKDIIVTIDPVKDFEKEEADRIRTKISLILQNFKPPVRITSARMSQSFERITIWYINCNFTG